MAKSWSVDILPPIAEQQQMKLSVSMLMGPEILLLTSELDLIGGPTL
jgi:hypothetical protein